MTIVNVDLENRPWVNVGVAECPKCKEICTAHIISRGQMSSDDWQKANLNFYCFSCRTEFQAPGTSALWLNRPLP